MSDIQKRTGSGLATAQTVQQPIAMLPAELQKSVRWFCSFYFETLKGTAAVASRFRWWMEEEGLTYDEARDAMRALMQPERSAEIDTAPKVVAALSSEVAAILRDRREKERAARAADGTKPNAVELERIKQKLAERMRPAVDTER